VPVSVLAASLPLPSARICNGAHGTNGYNLLAQTSDSIYLVGLHYRSNGHPYRGSGMIIIISRDKSDTTIINANGHLLENCPILPVTQS
jgi:hypothetical protein